MNYSQQANPNATNSEMDSKTIIKHPRLNDAQRDELIKQYVQIHVDSMDVESLEQFVTETLKEDYYNLSDEELKCEIECTHDEELYDELVDNVTNETVLDTNERELTTQEQLDYINSNLTEVN